MKLQEGINPVKFETVQQGINDLSGKISVDGRKELLDKAKEILTRETKEDIRKELNNSEK